MPTTLLLRPGAVSRSLTAAGLLTIGLATQATVITQAPNFALVVAPAQKITATNDGTGNPASVISNAAADSAQKVLTFNLFDPGLGTLNSVTFLFSSSVQGQTSVSVTPSQTDADVGDDTYFATGKLSRTLSGVIGLSTLPSTRDFDANCASNNGTGCSSADTETGSFDQPSTLLTPSSFLGPGTFAVTAKLDWTALAIGPDNSSQYADNGTLVGEFSGDWDGVVTLKYDYTPNTPGTGVPEPTSLYLVGAALVSAALLRRRRR